ncbi:K(+) efflux antiporter chloroplastic-like [Micractinium conductrix]|uniref:K(+) efflux antiporter chloroplastic-like n=1 Tax=Micractinium conductrix TaxID=554055 RepID=A0A2P6VGZ8_9CHLO|nr:K(+) efflux antiporter chloroplastic-like [Micractinium conductrix]|eukprot:PSC73360.1 K(+) efflux antiporter chloroplastic-like [Micractinium conductrix]
MALTARSICGLAHPAARLQRPQAVSRPAAPHRLCATLTLGHRGAEHRLATLVCKGGSKEGDIEATAAEGNGASALPAAAAAVAPEVDEEEAENNPELHPLKEALQRAKLRLEEATGIREALEAEAQKVAQLAVNAEGGVAKAKRQLEEAGAELEASQGARSKAADALAQIQAQMAQAAQAAAEREEAEEQPAAGAAVPAGADEDAAEAAAADAAAAVAAMEDAMLERSQELQAADDRIVAAQEKIAALQAKLAGAEDSAKAADGIAQAAMEAAEEAVRDEMETIAVFKEVEQALLKAIEDLRFLDDTSGRQEEEWDRKVVLKTVDSDDPSVHAASLAAAAEKAQKSAAKAAQKAAALDLRSLEEVKQDAARNKGWRGLVAAAQQHQALLLGCAVLAAAGGYFLHQQGVFAAAAAAAQSAAAGAARLWAVAAELVGRLPLPHIHIHDSEKGLLESIWLLLASVITVPLICKLPGGSPVLGFLAGGALIGPYALGIIQDVESIRHLAELGVVFLLFNIGLELSFDRLRSMGKFVFGMGTLQVVLTLAAVAYTAMALTGGALGGPGAIILGGGLALSTTAVGMQVLADRGETGTKFGRATFSVLLLQDLAVVVLLMLIPLLAPSPDGAAAGGIATIAKAIGAAAVKAVVTMVGITVAGRTLLRPLYKRVAETNDTTVFNALTLLVVLGTSLITQIAGLSLALGAFLAGLLLAETEYHLQVESDIGPYKGLLMGLFFMTVGMEISVPLFFSKIKIIAAAMVMLIGGKVAVMAAVGQAFGLSLVQSLRSGLLLSPGGEFAFVLFGEAVSRGIMGAALAKELYLVVALSMALTPFLAQFGGKLGQMLEKSDMKALQPKEGEMQGMSGHVIIAGFGRVGELIGQMLSERLIPFVALDVSASRVQEGKKLDLPVYFGDAGSPAVLHAVGAEDAACAVITLDTAGANYRSVWAMHKHFPHIKTFVRAFDIENGVMLEKAGATAVVPEVLEPSLQLAAAVLSQLNMPEDEVAETIRSFRKNHLSELQQLAQLSGSSLGYGSQKSQADSPRGDDEDGEEGAGAGGDGTAALPAAA